MATAKNHTKETAEKIRVLFMKPVTSIKNLQEIKVVTRYFEFEKEAFEDDLSKTKRAEKLRTNFPEIRKIGDEFNSLYQQLYKELYKERNTYKDADQKAIADYQLNYLNRIEQNLKKEKLKENITLQFSPDILNTTYILDGVECSGSRIDTWDGFSIELLDNDDLFNSYHALLYTLLGYLKDLVNDFEKRFKTKYQRTPIALSKKQSYNLREIILPEKWNDFVKCCEYYSEARVFSNNKTATLITIVTPQEDYRWNRIGKGGKPELAAFIMRLSEQKYFHPNEHSQYFIYQCFLYFFYGKEFSLHEANDVAKYANEKPNKYIGFFDRIK